MNGSKLALGAVGVLAAATALARRGSLAAADSEYEIEVWYDTVRPFVLEGASHMEKQVGRPVSEQESLSVMASNMRKRGGDIEAMNLSHAHVWIDAGKQVFAVGPALREMFVNTGLEKVPRRAIALPYTSFAVALPACPWRLWSQSQGWHEVRWAWVVQASPSMFSVMMIAPHEGRPGEFSSGVWSMDLDEVYGSGGDLESYLSVRMAESFRAKQGVPSSVQVEVSETHILFLRVLVNLLLYLQSNGADLVKDESFLAQIARAKQIEIEKKRTRKPKLIRRLERESSKLSGATVTWLGRRIEREAARQAVSEPGSRRAMRRHWVRGHWKWPARKTDRKLTWVMPYERGGRGQSVTGRTYRVREPSGE